MEDDNIYITGNSYKTQADPQLCYDKPEKAEQQPVITRSCIKPDNIYPAVKLVRKITNKCVQPIREWFQNINKIHQYSFHRGRIN